MQPLFANFALMQRLIVILLLVASFGAARAQSDSTLQVVQFSGLVVAGDSLSPVAFTTVYRERDKRGTITDNLGFFSIPAFAGDTIMFSGVGFLTSSYVIPDTLESRRYNMIQVLRKDTVQLETTFIYPWPTKERFRQEFLSLDLADSKEDLARRNLEAAMMYERMTFMEPDAREAYHYAIQQNQRQITYAGMVPTTSLLSPIAWGQFIQAWRRGDFKRQ